jgi:hypothetical protein
MLENFFNKINQEIDAKRTETPSSMAPTLKKAVELKPEDLEPIVDGPSEKAPTIRVLSSEELKPVVSPSEKAPTIKVLGSEELKPVVGPSEKAPTLVKVPLVAEKDVHGPLEAAPETLAMAEVQTFKTDATVALEKQAKAVAMAETAPTIRTEETMGEVDYDAFHNRVTDWLKRLDAMLATPQPMAELVHLKEEALKLKTDLESSVNLAEYGKAKMASQPFIVKIPSAWAKIEARLNEIDEAKKIGGAIKELPIPSVRAVELPTIKEIPTIKDSPTIKEPSNIRSTGPEATA